MGLIEYRKEGVEWVLVSFRGRGIHHIHRSDRVRLVCSRRDPSCCDGVSL